MRRLLPLLLALAGCPGPAPECTLSTLAAELAGDGAEDCGLVAVGADASTVDACTVAAFNEGRAFYALYELQGIDSQVTSAKVSDGADLYYLYRDSDPSGGGGVGAVVTRSECITPVVEAGEDGHDIVGCDDTSGCGVTVCGGDDGGIDCVD